MERKKNPKKDLNRNGGVFFITGLTMVLALMYVAIELKTFYKEHQPPNIGMVDVVDTIEEPNVVILPPPPPPPKIDPPKIDILPNDDDTPETEVVISQPTEEPPIAIDSVEYIAPDPEISIPITAVEVVPIFPGCENDTDKIGCFNNMMQKHIKKNFRYPEAEQGLGIQGRVHIMFEIQKNGSIGNVRMRGPNKNLENEAARIIDKLPQMTPGKQGGKNVRVPFSIPITFKLQ